MALSTYEDLKTAVSKWLARTELTSTIPDFITLAELRIARELRVKETIVGSIDTVSEQRIPIPTGFIEAYIFTIDASNSKPLEYRPIEDAERRYAGVTSGVPRFFSVMGSEIFLYPIPDTTYTYTIYYYSKWAPISDSNQTTSVFTLAPDLYLAGALAEGFKYSLEEERSSYWDAQFKATISSLNATDQRVKRTSGTRRMRVLV